MHVFCIVARVLQRMALDIELQLNKSIGEIGSRLEIPGLQTVQSFCLRKLNEFTRENRTVLINYK